MKMQRIIVKLPVELLSQLDEVAYLSRLTREELLVGVVSKGVGGGVERHVWITREEAAKRSGLNIGHIRKLCAQKYEQQGLSRKVRAAAGMPTWEIRQDANPAFAPAPPPVEDDGGRRARRRETRRGERTARPKA